MGDNQNKFEWDVKKKGDEEKSTWNHPAWLTFLQNYFPATKEEDPEYLTTQDIMDRLNGISLDDRFPQDILYQRLTEAGFKQLLPAPEGLFVWMVKGTPLQMISA